MPKTNLKNERLKHTMSNLCKQPTQVRSLKSCKNPPCVYFRFDSDV